MADISQIKLPNGDIFDLVDESKSTATNWVNGSQTGSVRTINSATEDSSYTIGTNAVAEGISTKASGTYSHAEGGGTTASNSGAHAEGSGSIASGNSSHAEGQSTTASGSYSHAEGWNVVASGLNAHAEGYGSNATNNYTHAEGQSSIASGQASHAEGVVTIANHLAQHVFGQYNIADPSIASADSRGNYIEIVGNGPNSSNRSNARTLDWSGNEVLAGKLTVGVTGTNSLDVATIGQLNNKSNATNWVNGSSTGSVRTTGSTAEYSNYTIGTYAVSEGSGTMARGNYSHAEGGGTIANGAQAHAEGGGTTASGSSSHAEGGGSQAIGDYSHAEGQVTIAYGSTSHTEGNSTITGDSSDNTKGKYAHAEGNSTIASGEASHAEGTGTTASSDASHSEGGGTTASGNYSHAEGSGSRAEGYASHAEGLYTIASGYASHADGSSAIANHAYQHAFGQYNIEDASTAAATERGNYVEIVGNGTAYNKRSNARTLDWSGNEWLAGKLTIGTVGTNTMDVATIGQLPTKVSDLTNDSGFATTSYVDSAINALPEPMIFKGSVGTGGTVTSLPTAAASNEGHTYKVISTLSAPSAKVGDTVISNGSEWIVIPSGDEPSGTVTSVGVSNGGGLSISGSPVTSSGTITISHADTSSQASSSNSGRTYIQSITLDTYGHVTGISTATETVTDTNTHRSIQMNGTEILGNNTTALNLKAGSNVSLSNSSGTVTIAATDTTYSSKAAASGGTDVSLVTTGEKYTWNSKTSNTGTITSVKTTAGAHSTINITSGAANFNVPTKTSHLTNDSGFITSSALNNYLPLTGGTLTGALAAKFSSIDASKANNNVSSTIYPTTFDIHDTGNRILTRLEGIVDSNGNIGTYWYVRNYNTSGTQVSQKGIKMTMAKDGTLTYSVSDESKFRQAIGAAAESDLDNYLPLTGGQVTGPTTFGDTVSTDDLNAGQLVVSGSASVANGINTSTVHADALIIQKHTVGSNTYADDNPKIIFQNGSASQNGSLTWTDYDSVQSPASLTLNGSQGNEYFITPNLKVGRVVNTILKGTGTAASDKGSGTSPRYFPAKWTFNTGRAPVDGDIIVIETPVAGHDYGVFLSIDNGSHYHPITLSGTGRLTTHWLVGSYVALIFDSDNSASSMYALAGSNSRVTVSGGTWRSLNYYSSGNTYTTAYCSTAAATAAKGASMSSYVATANRYIMVTMTAANTAASALTLNINGTGAKPIYINGSASSSSNHTLPAGSYLVFYNGTNYYFRTDGKITGSITGDAATVGGHTVGTNVPSNAKFTDTTYTAGTGIKITNGVISVNLDSAEGGTY